MPGKKTVMTTTRSAENTRYFAVSLFLMLMSNRIIFSLGHFLTLGSYHWDIRLPIDAHIPFLPWTVLIYNGVYLWWLFIYWLIAHRDRQEANHFFSALLLAKAISLLLFLFFPTSISRPELSGSSLWDVSLCLVYKIDSPDNLFPSIHCVLGWTCWIGVRGKKDLPSALRVSSFMLAVMVCLSTLTIRQHVLLDVFAGILLSEICYRLCNRSALNRWYAGLVDRLTSVLTAALHRTPRKK